MTLTILVEGETEEDAIAPFFRRWLSSRMGRNIAVKPRKFKGTQYLTKFAASAELLLHKDPDCIVLGLIDRYEWKLPVPEGVTDVYDWSRRSLERQVNDRRFRQNFAVHETEAWLLSDPSILPESVQKKFPGRAPEDVNLDEPPARLLERLYRQYERRKYSKRLDGTALFKALDPDCLWQMPSTAGDA